MKISLNTYNAVNFPCKFGSTAVKDPQKEKKALDARTRRVVSECTTVAVAASIIYFAMKSNIMENAVKKEIKKAQKIANLAKPEIILKDPTPELLNLIQR